MPGAFIKNASLKFVCKWVYVRLENNKSIFTSIMKKSDVLRIPVAHGDGNYYCTEQDLRTLKENSQIVFRYCSQDGKINEASNPNGSLDNIAGITNREGNVLGMMPHPERCSEGLLGGEDGRAIFESVISSLLENKKVKREA